MTRFKTPSTIIILLCLVQIAFGQQRLVKSINSNWLYYKGDLPALPTSNLQPNWIPVSIPHSWNDVDVMDDEPGYYRGVSWYKKNLYLPKEWESKTVYIHFEGAAQVAEIYLNGVFIGKHIGSYSAFNFNISKYAKYLNKDNTLNELVVKLDNSHNEDIAPLSADFSFFGGIYRDVYVVVLDQVHFDMDNYASKGIFITTPQVTKALATVTINGAFVNSANKPTELILTHTLFDDKGKVVTSKKQSFKTLAGKKSDFTSQLDEIKEPQLWSPDNPSLYTLISTLTEKKTGKTVDQLSHSVGFRWFNFDPDKGFFLNGLPIKLIGASRHQDYQNKANALTDALHINDVKLLKEMGGNFLRVAHYPQDPTILEACDRLGILTSVETPLVNRITESKAFAENAKTMQLEMIRQNYNHPSIIIWAYMNEILLRPRYEKGTTEQEAYFNNVAKLAQELETLTLQEDRARYTMIPNHGNFNLYKKYRLTDIPKLVGWNLYQGWYGGDLKGFDKFLDQHHTELPNKPLLVTEYGADADIRIHADQPMRFDKSTEYTTIYHQSYLKAMMKRSFVAAGLIWNLAEFNSEERVEAAPHMNTKGLLTYDRKPKDGYRFYQANLLKTPYLQIGSKEWEIRTGFTNSANSLTSIQQVQVFANTAAVALKLNGTMISTQNTFDGIATFNVPFVGGKNIIVVSAVVNGKEITDQLEIDFRLLNQDLKNTQVPFNEMNVSLGDARVLYDYDNKQIWIPEQVYQAGSWGYVGGDIYRVPNSVRQPYGSGKNIIGTAFDPMYQTQRLGIKEFRFDVPDGEYELNLHFAELLSTLKKEELVYNLTNQKETEEFKPRSFNVYINGRKAIASLSNLEALIPETAVNEKIRIRASENQGIVIRFEAIKDQPILNGIQLRKIY